MPQLANITINDGASTPVAHTFSPNQAQTGSQPSLLMDTSPAFPLGFPSMSLMVRASENQEYPGTRKVDLKLTLPVLSTKPGIGSALIPVLEYKVLGAAQFTFPSACSLDDRKNILAYVTNALSNAIIKDAILTVSPLY